MVSPNIVTTSKGKYKPNPNDYSNPAVPEFIYETVSFKAQCHPLVYISFIFFA